MSQYDREGPGMNCNGRNQYGITNEDLRDLKLSLSEPEKAITTNDSEMPKGMSKLSDLEKLLFSGSPSKEELAQYFEKHPDSKIVVAGGLLTKHGFVATNS